MEVIMKKIFMVGMGILCVVSVYAKSPSEQLIEFNKMKKNHKHDWLNHMLECKKKKVQLMKDEVSDMTNFMNEHIAKVAKYTDCSQAAKDAHMKEKLTSSIALCKKNQKAWHNLINEEYEKAQKLFDKHANDLMKFEGKSGEANVPEEQTATYME
jgi:hypothetical protein